MKDLKNKFYELPLLVQAITLILLLIIVFGLVGPSMISSNSTIAVWIGIAICASTIYVVWVLSKEIQELFK